MGLSRRTVELAIQIVAADDNARSRIDSILAGVFGRQAGFFRNCLMVAGYTVTATAIQLDQKLGKTLGVERGPAAIPFDPNRAGSMGYELQCAAIVEAATDAIAKRRNELPGITSVYAHGRSEGFAHGGVVLKTAGGAAYVLDWWATLDVSNPVVFRFDDFDMDRKDKGVPFRQFTGFPREVLDGGGPVCDNASESVPREVGGCWSPGFSRRAGGTG